MTATYEKIATTTLGSNTASVTFSSILASYTDLVLIGRGSTTTSGGNVTMQFNGDTGANYSRTRVLGNGSAASSERQSNTTSVAVGDWSTGNPMIRVNIQNYANPSVYKTLISRADEAGFVLSSYVGLWRNIAAITSVTFLKPGGLLTSGSTFTLYGIKAE